LYHHKVLIFAPIFNSSDNAAEVKMKGMGRIVLILFVAAGVLSCATSGPKYSEMMDSIPPLNSEKGRIYFYRVSVIGAAVQPDVLLNGQVVGQAVPNGFFYVDTHAGNCEIVTQTEVERKLSFNLGMGEPRYVRLNVSLGVLVARVFPELVDQEVGESEMAKLHYIGPETYASTSKPFEPAASPIPASKGAVNFVETYKWDDCTKPFKRPITAIVKPRPANIEVNLPDLVKKHNTIPLVVTAENDSTTAIQRGYLTVNNQPKNSAQWFIMRPATKKTVRINIDSKFLTAGTNTLKFRNDRYSLSHHSYNILQLRFDFSGMEDIKAYFAQQKTVKKIKSHAPVQPLKKTARDTTPPKIVITSHDTSRGIKTVQDVKKVMITGRAIDRNGIVEITVNSRDAIFDETGTFEADIYLKMGKNKVVVDAMDVYENRARKKFTITRVASKVPSKAKIAKTATGNYYALVIGNNNYKYLRKLDTAKKDAQEVAKTLRLKYGFEASVLLDANRNDILDAINNFRGILQRDDQFVIYYAGHGIFDRKASKAYWLPVDAQRNNDKNWIIVDTITSNIKRISSNHVLIVADSCYSGTFTRTSFQAKLDSAEKRRVYLKKMQAKKSRTLLASGGNEPVSDIGGQGHSIFARAFLVGLNKIESNEFTSEELYIQYIKEMVAGSSDQTPEYNIIRNSGHEGGDFIFRKKLASLEQQKSWKDERIKFTLNKMEIADDYPADIRKTFGPSKKLPKPKSGHRYAFFLITMTDINNVHVVGLGSRKQKTCILRDTAGKRYKTYMWTAKGINFPNGFTGLGELVEGAKILLIFETPNNVKPDRLTFIYYYKHNLQERSQRSGNIDIQI
jgi:hypothetical protein